MQDLYERQLALEEEYSNASLAAGQQVVLDAFKQGRAADISAGRVLLAKAFEAGLEQFTVALAKPSRGLAGKYRKLLHYAPPDVLVMAGLREVINSCASAEPVSMQYVLTRVGRIIEAESMLACMQQVNAQYTNRTVQYLDSAGTKSITHRYRTFLSGAQNMGMDWEIWSNTERVQVARILLTELYEATGLFKWVTPQYNSSHTQYYLEPSEALAKHFQDIQSATRAVIKYPPMLIKPMDWEGYMNGGYLTEWFRHNSPMCSLRYVRQIDRNWIVKGLADEAAQPVRDAMNKAQSTAYRVNKQVLEVLRKATAMRVGILGLPSFAELPQPEFPLADGWQKDDATESELEIFQLWKSRMAAWYTAENKRKGRHTGILIKLRELSRYTDEEALYFPTFIDWRGRLYFRSVLNPQSNDAVKGCLEFANGKPLGKDGLFWLKVHVANSCGYDKHDPELKAKWTDDNWTQIEDFINNPLDVDAPEPDTAFTLLQSGLALQAALSMETPEDYVCHVPVAMDATCSGLQHLSALTRDPVGAYYTNLIDNGADQKSDIYLRVASVADESKADFCLRKKTVKGKVENVSDLVLEHYWKEHNISRNMAKKPVMTFVYGSTLLSTIESIALDMSEGGMPVIEADGKVVYSHTALATPIGKALRRGVLETVPEAAKMMSYLQKIVRSHKDQCMRWFTPVGVPVVNWTEGTTDKRINIRSMGVEKVLMIFRTGEYDTRRAANGIVPNFVHSMDSAHLCATINHFDGDVLPIHDSFATHPSDVSALHTSLRSTFVDLYQNFKIEDFLEFNSVDYEEHIPPPKGNLDLSCVINSRYMFG